jgi:hypothetical protein
VAGAGLVTWVPGNVYLTPNSFISPTTTSPSIQRGVDAVSSGSTINVASGIFTEPVSIDKGNLALQGAGPGLTFLQGSIDCSVSNGNVSGITLSGGLSDITLTDFTVAGFDDSIQMFSGPLTNIVMADVATVDNCRHGLWSQAVGINGLTLNRVNASNNNSTGPQRFGRGVWIINGEKRNVFIIDGVINSNRLVGIDISDGNVSDLIITGNQVISNGDSGIGVLGPQGPGSTLVSGNTVENNGRFGIEIKNPTGNAADSGAGSVVVSNNAVSRTIAAVDLRDHAGIAVFRRYPTASNADQPSGTVITANQVAGYRKAIGGATGEGFGIVVEGHDHAVAGNTVTDSDIGIQTQAGNPSLNAQDTAYFDRGDAATTDNVSVTGNSVMSNSEGIRSIGPVTGTLTANLVYTNTANGVTILDESSTSVSINNNRICDNAVFGVENRGTSDIDATANWWNAVDGPGPVGPGSGDGVSARVLFDPFTTSNEVGPCAVASAGGELFLPLIQKNTN